MKKLILLFACLVSLYVNAQQNGDNKMFNLLAKFTVDPLSIPEFMEACTHSVIESRQEAGNIEMKLFADDKKSNVFYVYSRWDNRAAYEFHKTLAHSRNIAKVAKATLKSAPEIMPLCLTLPVAIRGTKQVNPEDKVETLFFTFKIKDGYRDRIIKRFETHVEHSRTEEGNLIFEFYTIDGDENSFVVYEEWRNSKAVWETHMKKPYSEVTGKLIDETLVGEMDQYLNFVTELEPNTEQAISKKWELSGFKFPESVVADPNSEWIYVSNIVDRETPGYISRISKDGKLDNYKWVEGLNQPCGLEIFDNKLYVGDQDRVHIIDIKKGKLIKSLSVEGSIALNDVSISKNGQVFISDVIGSKIYTIENNKLVVWLENAVFTHPNGLFVDGENLIVADLGAKLNPDASPQIPGSVYKVNIDSKDVKLMPPSYQLGGLDGVTKVGDNYVVTNNSGGEIYAVNSKERVLLGTLPRGIADLDSEDQTIYVPNFGGTVTAFKLIK